MKKTILSIFLTILSLNTFAQVDSEKRAIALTEKMTKALSLTKEEQSKIYEIQLERFQQVAIIRDKYQVDPEIKKVELKKVFNKLHGKLIKALGKDKIQQWGDYKREIGQN
tara:strand:- start:19 stop:351 length:333 start_codon:yes stop_codon:yes gene_type:complete